MLATRFTELLGLRAPLVSAPMSLHTGATIAAAVSAAGALGTFGGWNPAQGPEWITAQVEAIRAATDRPFGIGFLSHLLSVPLFEATLAAHTPVVIFSFEYPAARIAQAKAAGATVLAQVQTPGGADAAVDAGADVLIAQGSEAGGHTGTLSLLPFLAATARRFPAVPVLAAGGITDGRTLAAALTAGADGAMLGTAFLATSEAVEVLEPHKRAIVASDGADTVFTSVYDILGNLPWPEPVAMRTRRNRFTDTWDGREEELRRQRDDPDSAVAQEVMPSGKPDPQTYPFPYGQGAGAVSAIRSAADVVTGICDEAEQILRSRPPALLR